MKLNTKQLALWLVLSSLMTTPALAQPEIAAGTWHTILRKADGTLWTWGGNQSGQLGDGTLVNREFAKQIGTDTDWDLVVGGDRFSAATKLDGTLWVWGDNEYGQAANVGLGNDVTSPVQVLDDVVDVGAGWAHLVVLRGDGTIWTWGVNSVGQLGRAAGDDCGGTPCSVAPTQVGSGVDWVQVAAGAEHSLAIQRVATDDTLWMWGDPTYAMAPGAVPTQVGTDVDWKAVSAGAAAYHSLAIKDDNTLWSWGYNGQGQLGLGDEIDRAAPTKINDDTDWVSASGASEFTVATKSDGTVWVWGNNNRNQLGTDQVASANAPIQVGGATDWGAAVAGGAGHVVALKTNDSVRGWGFNQLGAVGDGSFATPTAPVVSAVTVDSLGPTTTVQIAGPGVTTTFAVTLDLTCVDASGCAQMQFSHDGVVWTPPEPATTPKSWTLAAGLDGPRFVHARFQDGAGNWGPEATDQVLLDTTPPEPAIIRSPWDDGTAHYQWIVVSGEMQGQLPIELFWRHPLDPTGELVTTGLTTRGRDGTFAFPFVYLDAPGFYELVARTHDGFGNHSDSWPVSIFAEEALGFVFEEPTLFPPGKVRVPFSVSNQSLTSSGSLAYTDDDRAIYTWRRGSITPVGSTGGGCGSSLHVAISDSGQMTSGYCYYPAPGIRYVNETVNGLRFMGDINSERLTLGSALGASRLLDLKLITTWEPLVQPAAIGQPLDTLCAGCATNPNQILDNGYILGAAWDDDGFENAVRWQGTSIELIGDAVGDGDSFLSGMNDFGEAVGNLDIQLEWGAVQQTAGISVDGAPLEPLWGIDDHSNAREITEDGLVVGNTVWWTQNGNPGVTNTAMVWRDGVGTVLDAYLPQELGEMYVTFAWTVNDAGMMVVEAYPGPAPFTGDKQKVFLVFPDESSAKDFTEAGEDGDPVSTFTGEFLLQESSDLDLGGPLPIRLARYYASKQGPSPALGWSWRHSYEWTARMNDTLGVLRVQTANGAELTLRDEDDDDLWTASGGWQAQTDGTDVTLLDPATQRRLIFGPEGRLERIEDGRGNGLDLTYDAGTQLLTQVADGLTRTLTFTYDADERLVSAKEGARTVAYSYVDRTLETVTDARGGVTTYAYDPDSGREGLLTSVTRPEGNVEIALEYDSQGRVARRTSPGGVTTDFDYVDGVTTMTDGQGETRAHVHDLRGALSSSTDELGREVLVGRDLLGRRTGLSDALGRVTTWTYDGDSSRIATQTLPDGATLSYAWSERVTDGFSYWDLDATTYPDGTTETRTYDARGNPIEWTDRTGAAWAVQYDPTTSQMTRMTRPDGTSLVYTVDAAGRLATVTDSNSGVAAFNYDGAGQRTGITHADGSTRVYGRDAAGLLTAITDERGATWGYGYDANGALASETNPAGGVTTFTRDDGGQLLTRTDPAGGVVTYSYDALGRPAGYVDATGVGLTLVSDAAGRIVTITDGAENVWTRGWDAGDRLVVDTDPLGNAQHMTWDDRDQLVTRTTAGGKTIAYEYDAIGRVTRVTDGLGNAVDYTWDAEGRPLSAAYPLGVAASFERDDLGRLTKATDGVGREWTLSWAGEDLLSSWTGPGTGTTSYAYDARGRITQTTLPLGVETTTRDAGGLITARAFDDGTSIALSYDTSGRVTGGTGLAFSYDARGDMSESNGLGYSRDAAGRLASVTYENGKTVDYTYDSRGLVSRVDDWAGGVTLLSWDAAGRLVGVERANGVDATYGWDADNALASITETQSGADLSTIAITRDLAGQITSLACDLPAEPTAPASSLLFDDTETRDAMGRRTTDGRRDYSWDLASRLTAYDDGGATVSFSYDAFGSRLLRDDGASTQYVWSYGLARPSVAVTRASGADQTYWVWLPDGTLLYGIDAATDARTHFHFDAVGHTAYLTDDAAQVVATYAYTPYGVVTARTGAVDNPFTWLGRHGVMEEASGLYYVRQRYYDAVSKRFLSPDPLALPHHPKDIDPHQYARGNPIFYVDVDGYSSYPEQIGQNAADQAKDPGYRAGLALDQINSLLEAGAEFYDGEAKFITDNGMHRSVVDGTPLSSQLRRVKGLQDASQGLRGAQGAVNAASKGLSAYGHFTNIRDTSAKYDELTDEYTALNDAAQEGLDGLLFLPLTLVKDKKLTPAQAEAYAMFALQMFQTNTTAARDSYQAGMGIAFLSGAQNAIASLVPGHTGTVVGIVFKTPSKY